MRKLLMIPLRIIAIALVIPAAVFAVVLAIPAFILDIILIPFFSSGACWCLTAVTLPIIGLGEFIYEG